MVTINRIYIAFWLVFMLLCSCSNSQNREIEYYDDGSLKSEYFLKNELKEGDFVEYFKNGKVKYRINYEAGKKSGKAIYYYETGEIYGVTYFKNDVNHGETRNYYKNGKMKDFGIFYDGVIRGDMTEYREDGTLRKKLHIVNYQKKQKTSGILTYDNGEKVIDDYRFPHRTPKADTIKLGEKYIVEVYLNNPELDSSYAVYGDYRDDFTLTSLASIDTIAMKNHKVTLAFKPLKSGLNYARGYIVNTGMIKRKLDDGTIEEVEGQTPPIYFEQRYYVKP